MPTHNLNSGAAESPAFRGDVIGGGLGHAAYQVFRADRSEENFSVRLEISLDGDHWDDVATVDQTETNEVVPFVRVSAAFYRWTHDSGAGVVAVVE